MNVGLELLVQFNAAREKVRAEMLTQEIQEALIDFGERAMKMQRDQLRTDKAVERLANFLFEDDNGESIDQHEKICHDVSKCQLRSDYTQFARAAITAVLGEEL